MSGDWTDLADMMKNGRIEIKSSGEKPAPWRFDVPEVPDSVTAIKDRDGVVWLRERTRDYDDWVRVDEPEPGLGSRSIAELLELAPLVECEDPRAAS